MIRDVLDLLGLVLVCAVLLYGLPMLETVEGMQ